MEVYNSEQDQVEAIKAWWDKHGKLVIAGVVALLVGVFGWNTWQDRQLQMADAASTAYYQMLETVAQDPNAAMAIGRHIVGEFSSTTYAPLASMMLARLSVEEGDLASAEAHLQTVAAQRKLPELQRVARLRLAQVIFAQGRHEQALAQLQGDAGSLQAAFDEMRGDILLAQGQREQARAAYSRAASAYADQPDSHALVSMKLNDLEEHKAE
ncbi:MAG: tetratricopeptide repeat protein [Chromatiales bacterium]|nr:tetratricopeptide repeat protein [Gammaproteobacteria bacterium]MBW6476473.1 tetratricopeptide repeat protein [Chromatiales bacterium]